MKIVGRKTHILSFQVLLFDILGAPTVSIQFELQELLKDINDQLWNQKLTKRPYLVIEINLIKPVFTAPSRYFVAQAIFGRLKNAWIS